MSVNKQFYVDFPTGSTEAEQNQALMNLMKGFDRRSIGAMYTRVSWVVAYEDDDESIQGNITFDPASTDAEKVVARWKQHSGKSTSLRGKETLGKGDHMTLEPEFQEGRKASKDGLSLMDCPYLGVLHGEKRMPRAAWMFGYEVEARGGSTAFSPPHDTAACPQCAGKACPLCDRSMSIIRVGDSKSWWCGWDDRIEPLVVCTVRIPVSP